MASSSLRYAAFLCCFALPLMPSSSEDVRSIPKLDRSWRTYHNGEWGYCVSYPSRWLRGDAFDGAGLFVETGVKKFSKPLGEIDVIALPDPTTADQGSPVPLTLVESLQVHLDGLRRFERAEQIEVLESRPMQLVGASALFTKDRYHDPQDGSSWVDEIVFAKYKGRLYRLELTSQTDQLPRFEPVFARVVSTFRFECDSRR
jgi:hypothetical protein